MSSYLSLGLLLALFLAFSPSLGNIPYYGMRVGKSLKTLNRDNIYLFNKFAEEDHDFYLKDVKLLSGNSFTRQGLQINHIDFKRGYLNTSEFSNFSNSLTPEGIYSMKAMGTGAKVDLSFDYSFLFMGVHIYFGNADMTVLSHSVNFTQNFSSGVVNTTFNATWNVTDLKIYGTANRGLEKWIVKVAHSHILPDLNFGVDSYMETFNKGLLGHIYEIHHYFPRDLNLTMKNALSSVAPSTSGGSTSILFAFHSNLTIENRPYNRQIMRYITTDSPGAYDFQVCYNLEIIPGFLDVIGQSRYFNFKVNQEKNFNADPSIGFYAQIVPELYNRYSSEEEVEVGCSFDKMMVEIVSKSPSIHRMQAPMNCTFNVKSSGEQFLSVENFLWVDFAPKVNGSSFYGVIESATMSEVFITPSLSSTGVSIVSQMMETLANSYKGLTMLESPGIETPFLREKAEFTGPTVTVRAEDICLNYMEAH